MKPCFVDAIVSHQVRLAARPDGLPKAGDWNFTTEPLGSPAAGEVALAVRYISVDPAMRGWMNDAPSYLPPVGIGDVMRAIGIGEVIASNDPRFATGDLVSAMTNVQSHVVIKGNGATKIDPHVAPPPVWLNTLGMPGMTAYFGLLDVGQPQPGQTVVVSGAAGAVGATVGQIAKIRGCRAIGIAGGPEKCAYVASLGFDGTIDYKTEHLANALKTHAPNGIDVYFDNVGGATLDAALARLAMHARIVICGAISQYNSGAVTGPANYLSLLVKRARMQGMVVMDYADRYAAAGGEIAGWIAAGKLRSREDIVAGLEAFPEALSGLFAGSNFGKLILKVAAD